MSTTTIELIHKYVGSVRQFTEVLKSDYGVDNIPVAKRSRIIPLEGVTRDSRFSFCFHGIGCRAECSDFAVDFDFGEGGAIGGFDAYRLAQFAASLKSSDGKPWSEDEICEDLRSLLAQGLVVSPRQEPSPHLMYLKEDKPM